MNTARRTFPFLLDSASAISAISSSITFRTSDKFARVNVRLSSVYDCPRNIFSSAIKYAFNRWRFIAVMSIYPVVSIVLLWKVDSVSVSLPFVPIQALSFSSPKIHHRFFLCKTSYTLSCIPLNCKKT